MRHFKNIGVSFHLDFYNFAMYIGIVIAAYTAPRETCEMELFAKIINWFSF